MKMLGALSRKQQANSEQNSHMRGA
jgi:hypothetical protein